MPPLALSTKEIRLDFSFFRLEPDSEEILRILSRAIDPRVAQASRPAIILTSRHDMNQWARPDTHLAQVAAYHTIPSSSHHIGHALVF